MLENRTPHTLHIFNQAKELVKAVEPVQGTLRVSTAKVEVDHVEMGDGFTVPINSVSFGDLVQVDLKDQETVIGQGLPCEKDGVFIVLSQIAAVKALQIDPARRDLLVVGETVRDEDGKIVGCTSFSRP